MRQQVYIQQHFRRGNAQIRIDRHCRAAINCETRAVFAARHQLTLDRIMELAIQTAGLALMNLLEFS
jgi:hypothetical protein